MVSQGVSALAGSSIGVGTGVSAGARKARVGSGSDVLGWQPATTRLMANVVSQYVIRRCGVGFVMAIFAGGVLTKLELLAGPHESICAL